MSTTQFTAKPDIKISVKQTFGFESNMELNGFSKKMNLFQRLILITNLIKIRL